MNKLDYLNLEYKIMKNKMEDINNNMKINCNIMEHKLHNSLGSPPENLMIDLLINLGNNSEKGWITIENIVRKLANNAIEKNKLIKQNIERLQSQSLILEEIQKKLKKNKNLEIPDIINAVISARELEKPKLIETETNNLLREIKKIASNIEEKLKKSIEHDKHVSEMLKILKENFDRLFGS